MSDAKTTEIIRQLLLSKHPGPEWAVFSEVRNGTGFRVSARYIDVYAFNLWPSNDFRRIAYEIKVSRSDFSRELADPSKREAAENNANECYFVTTSGLVQSDEVPEGWGLIEMTRSHSMLRTKKHARQRKVEPPSLLFVASLLRQASNESRILPSFVWKFEGKEIPADKLVDAANDVVRRQSERELQEIRSKIKQEDWVKEMMAIKTVISDELGWQIANSPEALRETIREAKYKAFDQWEAGKLRDAAQLLLKLAGTITPRH